jgi:hypothetical protein
VAGTGAEDRPRKADVMAVFEDEWSYPETKNDEAEYTTRAIARLQRPNA